MAARIFNVRVAGVIALGTILAVMILLAGAWVITTNRVDDNQRKQDRDLCELLDAISYPRSSSNAAGQKFQQHLTAYEKAHCHG